MIASSRSFALALGLLLGSPAAGGELATVAVAPDGLVFEALAEHDGLTLVVSDGRGFVYSQTFAAGAGASFDASGLADGTYKWELRARPVLGASTRAALEQARQGSDEAAVERLRVEAGLAPAALVQSGSFGIASGRVLDPGLPESARDTAAPRARDLEAGSAEARSEGAVTSTADRFYVGDNLYVRSSACIGYDCPTSGLAFGHDTIVLRENNLRIFFQDTSTGSYPGIDWRLVTNASTLGGLNKFSIDDATFDRSLFTVEGAAPDNALYVEVDGDVGFGTSAPLVDLHVIEADSPTLRLEQTGASGFSPQTWDIVGNDSNFFIRDVNSGSKLPFRIRPGADSNSVYIDSDGDVGLGTSGIDSGVRLQVQANTSSNFGGLRVENSGTGNIQTQFANTNGGWEWRQTFRSGDMIFDSQEDGANEWELDTAGNVTATSFNPASARELKQGFEPIDPASVLERLAAMPVTRWSYRHDPATPHIGPVAQDFHAAFGVGADDKHISTTDADGVAFAAIQALYRQQLALNEKLEARNAELERRLEALEAAMEP